MRLSGRRCGDVILAGLAFGPGQDRRAAAEVADFHGTGEHRGAGFFDRLIAAADHLGHRARNGNVHRPSSDARG